MAMNETKDDAEFDRLKRWLGEHNEPKREGLTVQQTRDFAQRGGWILVYLIAAVVLAAWLAFCSSAEAQIVPRDAAQVSWVNATQNTDGTAIPTSCPTGQTQCGRLTSTRVEYGSCGPQNTFGAKVGQIDVAWPGTSVLVSGLVVQTYCFRAFHRNDYGSESAASNVATKTIQPPTPGSPQNLTVRDSTAYRLDVGYQDQFKLVVVGLVPLGVPCSSRQVLGLNTVLIGKRTIIDGKKTSPLLKDSAGNLVSVPMQVLARCG